MDFGKYKLKPVRNTVIKPGKVNSVYFDYNRHTQKEESVEKQGRSIRSLGLWYYVQNNNNYLFCQTDSKP